MLTMSLIQVIKSKSKQRVLIIFPHPDDELLGCAGVIKQFLAHGHEVHYIVLTKGECGTEGAHYKEELKEIRSNELARIEKVLNLTSVEQFDLGDGHLTEHKKEAESIVENHILALAPTVVISFDQTGMYGHPDHITTHEVVEKLAKKFSLPYWGTSLAPWMRKMAKLPTHMAKPGWNDKMTSELEKVWTIGAFATKVKGIYIYASQKHSYKNAVPVWFPLWLLPAFSLCEYFTPVYLP